MSLRTPVRVPSQAAPPTSSREPPPAPRARPAPSRPPPAPAWPALLGSPAPSLHPPYPAPGPLGTTLAGPRGSPDARTNRTGRGDAGARAGRSAAAGVPRTPCHASRAGSPRAGRKALLSLEHRPPFARETPGHPGTASRARPSACRPRASTPGANTSPGCPSRATPGDNGSPIARPSALHFSHHCPPPLPGRRVPRQPRFSEV